MVHLLFPAVWFDSVSRLLIDIDYLSGLEQALVFLGIFLSRYESTHLSDLEQAPNLSGVTISSSLTERCSDIDTSGFDSVIGEGEQAPRLRQRQSLLFFHWASPVIDFGF